MEVIGTLIGEASDFTAKAAVAPATCPIVIHEACTLNAELASLSLLTHRPATMKFLLFFGIRALSGTVGTTPYYFSF